MGRDPEMEMLKQSKRGLRPAICTRGITHRSGTAETAVVIRSMNIKSSRTKLKSQGQMTKFIMTKIMLAAEIRAH